MKEIKKMVGTNSRRRTLNIARKEGTVVRDARLLERTRYDAVAAGSDVEVEFQTNITLISALIRMGWYSLKLAEE